MWRISVQDSWNVKRSDISSCTNCPQSLTASILIIVTCLLLFLLQAWLIFNSGQSQRAMSKQPMGHTSQLVNCSAVYNFTKHCNIYAVMGDTRCRTSIMTVPNSLVDGIGKGTVLTLLMCLILGSSGTSAFDSGLAKVRMTANANRAGLCLGARPARDTAAISETMSSPISAREEPFWSVGQQMFYGNNEDVLFERDQQSNFSSTADKKPQRS